MAAPIVRIQGDQVFANSLDVAEFFGRRHADVLRAIDGLDCSADFRERNFAFSPYHVPGQSRSYAAHDMTKDGFTFLVMGFTGAEAARFREAYIQAFNDMEAKLRNATPALPDFTNPAAAARAFAVEWGRMRKLRNS